MIVWGDVIDIITSAFNINQTKLADLMGYDKATISRIRCGIHIPPFGNEQLFLAVFAPADSCNSINKDKESNYRLGYLKDIIKDQFKEVRESLSDCWDETSYETFVMTLLNRARKGAASKKRRHSADNKGSSAVPPGIASSEGTTVSTHGVFKPIRRQPQSESEDKKIMQTPPPKRMTDVFFQSVQGFPIKSFIERDPSDSLPAYCIRDALSFWGQVNTQRNHENDPDRTAGVYQKIIEFIDTLEKYLRFLKQSSASPDTFPEWFRPVKSSGNKFETMSNDYRRHLKSLFQTIYSELEQEVKKCSESQRDEMIKAKIGTYHFAED